MKKLMLAIILLAAVTLVACAVDTDDEATGEPALPGTTSTAAGSDNSVADPDAPVSTGIPGSDGYPGPDDNSALPATALPAGYPVPSRAPTRDPYPSSYAILIRPAGVQCEDPLYADMDAAVADLKSAGVKVHEVSQVELMVCQACGCPTSNHYRVRIEPLDLETALTLGWERAWE